LGLADHEWTATFQSRFGGGKWLQPATDATVRALGAEGLERIDVACPGFSRLPGDAGGDRDPERRLLPRGRRQGPVLPPLPQRRSGARARGRRDRGAGIRGMGLSAAAPLRDFALALPMGT